ncbi:hypothetical protein Syun_021213 [Stephania yunnanensis]|uniref:Uncharacterized protein n=1 Tax=Stephania yunnanensis TaxID=152371 RepID=A0AAP0NS37_9MAGN
MKNIKAFLSNQGHAFMESLIGMGAVITDHNGTFIKGLTKVFDGWGKKAPVNRCLAVMRNRTRDRAPNTHSHSPLPQATIATIATLSDYLGPTSARDSKHVSGSLSASDPLETKAKVEKLPQVMSVSPLAPTSAAHKTAALPIDYSNEKTVPTPLEPPPLPSKLLLRSVNIVRRMPEVMEFYCTITKKHNKADNKNSFQESFQHLQMQGI